MYVELGQTVYKIKRIAKYNKHNNKVHKWAVDYRADKVIDSQEKVSTNNKKKVEKKRVYYIMESGEKVKSDRVFSTIEEAEEQCNIRNNWNKYFPRTKGYKETHPNKFKKKNKKQGDK